MSENNPFKDSKALKVSWFFIRFAWYASWFVLVLGVVIIIMGNFSNFGVRYVNLPVEVSYRDFGENLPLDQIATAETAPVIGFSMVQIDISQFPWMINMIWIPLGLLLGLMWMIKILSEFLRKVRQGKPFDPKNPLLLKQFGLLVVCAGPVFGLLNFIYANICVHLIELPGADIKMEPNVYPFLIFLGLMILVIAKIFDLAVEMKNESDLTI